MKALPVAAGALALVLVLTLGSGEASAAQKKISNVVKARPGHAIVRFTQDQVIWRKNPKTGEVQYRTEVRESPEVLAMLASNTLDREVPVNVFILATLIASEAEDQPDNAKVAIAYAALTKLKKERQKKPDMTLANLLMSPVKGKGGGKLGGQRGRYASTARPPSERDIEIIEKIADGEIPNPTPGAFMWDDPNTQDAQARRGEVDHDSKDIAARREGSQLVSMNVPGVSPRDLRMWKPAGDEG